MSGPALVLDSQGLSLIAHDFDGLSNEVRALFLATWKRKRPVLVPAVVCAEVCRTAPLTRAVESLLARHASHGDVPIEVIPTTFELAKKVGVLLADASMGSAGIVDAHVVAVAAQQGGGVILTSDPDDIRVLADCVRAVRIVTRRC